MSVEIISPGTLFSINSFWFVIELGMLILLGLYFFFSLLIIRQVNLMTEILITEVSPILRALAIIHAGLALGIIILVVGLLFG